jgi:hypothetical protein
MILTEQQLLAIIHAARPLQSNERTAFLAGLEVLFAGRHEIGDGELNCMLRDLQRKHFRPPAETTA